MVLCAEAINGVHAVRKPQESHPDVANVDFQMLLMNGLEVTRRIRLLCPSYTVLIFAQDYSSELEWESECTGADVILPKAQGVGDSPES